MSQKPHKKAHSTQQIEAAVEWISQLNQFIRVEEEYRDMPDFQFVVADKWLDLANAWILFIKAYPLTSIQHGTVAEVIFEAFLERSLQRRTRSQKFKDWMRKVEKLLEDYGEDCGMMELALDLTWLRCFDNGHTPGEAVMGFLGSDEDGDGDEDGPHTTVDKQLN